MYGVVFPAQRNANSKASNATSSWVKSRTATTSGHCDNGLGRRREQVTAKGGGTPCVGRQEARRSLHIKRRSYVSSSLFVEHDEVPSSSFFLLHVFKLIS